MQGKTEDNVTQAGFVALIESTLGTKLQNIFSLGTFTGYDEPLPGPFSENPFAEFADTCTVSSTGDPVDPVDPVDPYPEGTPLDAGPQLTIEAGGEIYTTLDPLAKGTCSSSFVNLPTPPLPDSSLTVDIPGAEFPAFTNAAFANVSAFTLTAPATQAASPKHCV